MASSLVLDVADWAALISAEQIERLGAAEEASAIPPNQRRRLPAFARDVVRCALPLLRAAPDSAVVFASCNGDLASTVTLLSDIARREILSPTLFSLSVHNGAAGALSLCVEALGDHTAIAAGEASLAAALVEAYARLASGETRAALLIYADHRLPPVYAGLDDDAPGVVLAMRLTLPDASVKADASPGRGRSGAAGVARALANGARRIAFAAGGGRALAA